MEVCCPKCKWEVPPEGVNVATDVLYCGRCREGFALSVSLQGAAANIDLDRPPAGAWFERTGDGFVAGGSTRSPTAFFVVPFMCVWSGFSLTGIYGTQIASGKFNLYNSLFGIPFLLGSVVFWSMAAMTVYGKETLTVAGGEGRLFTGVGRLGWTRRFAWADVSTVAEGPATWNRSGSSTGIAIVLEGKSRMQFGSMLSEARRYFVLNAVRKMRAGG